MQEYIKSAPFHLSTKIYKDRNSYKILRKNLQSVPPQNIRRIPPYFSLFYKVDFRKRLKKENQLRMDL